MAITCGTAKSLVEAFAALESECNNRSHSLLLERGEHFTSRVRVKDVPVAREWAKRVRPKARQCYMNAAKFVMDHAEARYYEGYWSAHAFPVWHAWVVLDGKVIDFTAEACERKLKRADVALTGEQDYFGVHVPTEFVVKRLCEMKTWCEMLPAYFAGDPTVPSL